MWGKSIVNFIALIVVTTSLSAQNKPTNTHRVFQKGRIEWVLPSGIDLNHPVSKIMFQYSEAALKELETNLIYKTNNKILLQAYSDFASYSYQIEKTKTLQSRVVYNRNLEKLSLTPYSPILITGNYIDLMVQIRRAVVEQFLNEYLLGFQFFERFDAENQKSLPLWLREGFVSNFSEGITHKELLYFKYLHEEGAFKNLNFIHKDQEELFGKVIWYFIEREKGTNSNSIFWSLIKYIRSFDNSFEFQFGEKFSSWLDQKAKSIQNSHVNTLSSDVTFPQIGTGVMSQFHFDSKSKRFIQGLKEFDNTRFYLVDLSQKNVKTKRIEPNTHLNNELTSFCFEKNSMSSRPAKWHGLIWENGWKFISAEQRIELSPAAKYQLISVINDSAWLLKEELGKTYILSLDIKEQVENPSIQIGNTGEKIIQLLPLEGTDFVVLSVEKTTNGFYSNIEILSLSNRESKSIFTYQIPKPNQGFEQLVWIDSNQFSLVKNSVTENSIYHFIKKHDQDTFTFTKTPTKGLFYKQLDINKDTLLEVYYQNNQFKLNYIPKQEPILDRDTFKQALIATSLIDTIQNFSSKPKSYDTSRFFVSGFEKMAYQKLRTQPRVIKENPWISQTMINWFFLHRAKFHLSNKEISTLHDAEVSPVNQYNSPLTFFWENTFFDAQLNHRFDVSLFSNINRRRVGFEINHHYIISNKWNVNSNLSYRLRQFLGSELSNIRNRSTSLYVSANRNITNDLNGSIGISLSNSQLVPINNNPDKIIQNTTQRGIIQLPLNLNYLNQYSEQNYLYAQIGIGLGSIFHQDKILGAHNLNFNIESQTRFSHFYWKGRLSSRYSVSAHNISYTLGGTEGWISSNANTNSTYNNLNISDIHFFGGNLSVRGLQMGTRIGNSFTQMSQDLGFPLLRLFPKSLKERQIWRSMIVYGFFDGGLAFFGPTPSHYSNPYNTITFFNPNYTLIASSRQNPWIWSYGYGAQFTVLGYPFRIEYAHGYEGNVKLRPRLVLSLGKNF